MSSISSLRRTAWFVAAAAFVAAGCSGASGVLPGAAPTTFTPPLAASTVPEADPLAAAAPTTTSTTTSVAPEQPQSVLPDVTAAAIDVSRLETLLPASIPGATGPAEIEDRSNDALIAGASPDRSDEADDVVVYGRIGGIAATYPIDAGTAHIWIDLLPDDGTAHSYLLDAAGDVAKGVGPIRIGAAPVTTISEFPVDGLGDEAIGLIMERTSVTETAIVMRLGRLVVMTSIAAPGEDRRVATHYLAEEAASGIIAALLGGTAAPPVISPTQQPDAAAFDLKLEATAGFDTVLTVRARGRSSGSDLTCLVEVGTAEGIAGREFVRVGALHWTREPAGDWAAAGLINAMDAALLGWCPAWPLDLEAAGLASILEREPARLSTTSFGSLLGYPGDIDQLAAALGAPLRGTELTTLNAWVIESDGTLIEVNLEIAGPTASLAPLTGPWPIAADWIEISLRHRVEALGDDVAPVTAPR